MQTYNFIEASKYCCEIFNNDISNSFRNTYAHNNHLFYISIILRNINSTYIK